jgi:hypothetical protein
MIGNDLQCSPTRAERLFCCVPFCTRSRGERKYEPLDLTADWICPAHWGLVSPRRKRLLRVIRRRIRINPDKVSLRPIGERVWAQAKAEAIEMATGIRTARPGPPPPAGPPPRPARAARPAPENFSRG